MGIFVVIREIFISYLDTYNYINIILHKYPCAIGTYIWLCRVFREKRRHFKESVKFPWNSYTRVLTDGVQINGRIMNLV